MNKKIALGIAAAVVLGGITYGTSVQAHGNAVHSTPTAGTVTHASVPATAPAAPKWTNKHVAFTESAVLDGKTVFQDVEAWFDNKGHFRVAYLSGPNTGNYNVWDGHKFYQYFKNTGELVVAASEEGKELPVAHPFFSGVIFDQMKDDIQKNALVSKGHAKAKQLAFEVDNFAKTETFNEVSQSAQKENKSVYKAKANTSVTEISLNKEFDAVTDSTTTVNGELTHELHVTTLEKLNKFDDSLLTVIEPSAHILETPAHHE